MSLRLVILPVLLAATSNGVDLMTEVEKVPGGLPVHSRSNASGGKTLYFREGDSSLFVFCLARPTTVNVMSIGYTNDGGSDTVQVEIGTRVVGSFTSVDQSESGNLWNAPMSSGLIGTSALYGGGVNRLKLKVMSSDAYGIELDNIVLRVDDPFVSNGSRIFSCELPCLEEIPPVVSKAVGPVTDGYMNQNSYFTPCAEEDNVDIPVFHSTVTEYTISATPPIYHTMKNNRYEDTSNCPFLPPEYWSFQKVNVEHLLQSQKFTSKGATLSLSDTPAGGFSTPLQFSVIFKLQGKSVGHIDSEIGSKLDLTLSGLTSNAEVSLLYKGRASDFRKETLVKFTHPSYSHTWNIPDFTWIEKSDNEIVLKISTSQTSGIVFDTLKMERRYMGPDTSFTIFSDENIHIEGIDVDFWWRAPETMHVTLSTTNQTWKEVDYLRISVPVPWNNTWSEVFVMYQDGNVRLLPITLVGTDWIPFGTSVIVGQTDADDHRPVAPLSQVTINPADLTMDLGYMDGGCAKFELSLRAELTRLLVNELHFTQNRKTHPFATFRSMFVADGNNDSDSVMTDRDGPQHVMDDWGMMSGTSFFVYRRCQSDHLSQSPNLRVDIYRTD